MERRFGLVLSLGLVVAGTGCIIVGDDTNGTGASNTGGSTTTTGGTSTNGGNGGSGGSNAGGTGGVSQGGTTANGGAGQGGAPQCQEPVDCPLPEFECFDPICPEGVCLEDFTMAGTVCSVGICDGQGYCVECIDDTDCAANQHCDVASGACVNDVIQGGVCGDNFCQGLPADNACFACIQDVGIPANAQCHDEYLSCVGEGAVANCVSCLDYFNGEAGNFCNGSQTKVLNLLSCTCAPGVCAN